MIGDYYSGEHLQDLAEVWLLEIGGEQLRVVAHDIARVYAVPECPSRNASDELWTSVYISSLGDGRAERVTGRKLTRSPESVHLG